MRVTGGGPGVDNAREQKELEARKMLAVGAAESPASSGGCVWRWVTARFFDQNMIHCKLEKVFSRKIAPAVKLA